MRHIARRLAPVVPAHGPELGGPLRAAVAAFPPEPYDLWLACRNAVAPFRERALVVGGGEALAARARRHFVSVHQVASASSATEAAANLVEHRNQQLLLAGVTGADADDADGDRGEAAHKNMPSSSASGGQGVVDVCFAHAGLIPLGSPSDLALLLRRYRPLLRPHGCFCIAGARMPGELLHANAETSSDWADMRQWLVDKSTPEERFAMVDGVLAPGDVRAAARGAGLVNTSFFTFESEYSVSMPQLGGLVRSLPAYRRAVTENRSASADPFEVFAQCAAARNSYRGDAADRGMRLKLEYWMWVCDSRPRSRDVVEF